MEVQLLPRDIEAEEVYFPHMSQKKSARSSFSKP